MLVSLVETGEVAAWAAMVIIAREFAVTGLRLVAAAEDVIISAGRFGKAKAFSQNVALAVHHRSTPCRRASRTPCSASPSR